ncbi:sialate O-acetylesterase [Zobellia uliginosa]|uniref:sialate O-acetylesterase n=1 Tax=Zobellia uliginosa TaxID=143224 RepID=UPI001C07485A|nr:sialate O-acetylesterase [Zobellia uliginosa]MBU2947150.1 sialate O-acetylesterase [Zobellia uliginosa]
MKHTFFYLILLTCTFVGCKTANIDTINAKALESIDVKIVLLAGQSNMAGAGNFDELSPVDLKRIEHISKRVSLSFNGKPAEPLSYYDNKPNEKYAFLKRFGPELFMGLTLAERNPYQEFLLIKRSQGGTALYGAWNPNWTAKKAKEVEKGESKQNLKLYDLHITDIKKNIEVLKTQNKTYKIIGLAWMQGENDAAKEISATTYKDNLRILIKSYREDLGNKNLSFVIGQINSRYGKFQEKGPAIVRQAMNEVSASDNQAAIIKTSTDTTWADYPKHTDNVHYNTKGQKRLGIAFANKLSILNQ